MFLHPTLKLIRFIDRENILVDNITTVTKSKMEDINLESKNSELPKLPPPPLPRD
ncbi:hypothetical protein [Winogradskyella vidalii]|uniref:hypothetical protein n=1 Tax=Winogradskyella vidalii TaxID=2615024 RepID=UPI0015CE3AA2|nr:hypothetical protein [Winogradskyella vidalii]